LDYQETMTHPFYVMEFVEAPSLTELLDLVKRTETEEQIASTIVQICDALSYIHRNQQIHGNLSSDSILILEQEGQSLVKLAGMGTRSAYLQYAQSMTHIDGYASFDRFKQLVGTIQSDIYAAAAITYQMTVGKLPFDTLTQDILAETESECGLLKLSFLRPDLFSVKELDSIIDKAMNPNQDDRFETIEQFRQAISSWLEAAKNEMIESDYEPLQDDSVSAVRRWSSELKSLEDLEGERVELLQLKSAQVKGEQTVAMQLTRAIASKGRRKSPIRAIAELVFLVLGSGILVFTVINFIITNFDSLKTKYMVAARGLSQNVNFKEKGQKVEQAQPEGTDFDYRQSPIYTRWTKNKEVKPARRIEINGSLKER
ncbi:MAG: protein kinase, partial [Candidatus Obscuribacterales bacterium]|nr:protein kinase [Candidatus Obscuribacterales bacterium]